MDGGRIAAIAGDLADAEAMLALKDLMAAWARPISMPPGRRRADPSCRAGYLFNTTIAGIEQADACLLIGTNPRLEAAILNARLRKRWLAGGFKVAFIGPRADLTIPLTALGSGAAALADVFHGNMNGPRC